MATIREKRPGVWEVRAFTGRDERGRPTQVSRTVHGTKRDAQRAAAEMTLRPSKAGGRTVAALIEIVPGAYVVVGNEEADSAVAEVVSVEPDGVVLVRVLPGPAEEHRHLTGRQSLHRSGVNGNDELEETIQELEARHPGIRTDMRRMGVVLRMTTALWQRREELGLSVEQVADRSGLTLEEVEAVEDNDVDSPFQRLARYAEAVGLQFELRQVPA